jgi:hypothetical protein
MSIAEKALSHPEQEQATRQGDLEILMQSNPGDYALKMKKDGEPCPAPAQEPFPPPVAGQRRSAQFFEVHSLSVSEDS